MLLKFEENLRWWVDWLGQLTENDPVATWVSERSMESNSATLDQILPISIGRILSI